MCVCPSVHYTNILPGDQVEHGESENRYPTPSSGCRVGSKKNFQKLDFRKSTIFLCQNVALLMLIPNVFSKVYVTSILGQGD